MPELAVCSTRVDVARISAVLEVARTILHRKYDQDLIQKVTVLQAYFELSQLYPDRDYGPVLRRAITELTTAIVHLHLKGELHGQLP